MATRSNMVKSGLGLALFVMAALSAVILISVVLGYCLHWLIPAINLASATTIGALAFFFFGQACIQFYCASIILEATNANLLNSDDDEDRSLLSDDQIDEVADRIIHSIFARGDGAARKLSRLRRAGK